MSCFVFAVAEVDKGAGVLRINPDKFDYLAIRHEGRHFTQLKINEKRGLDTNKMFDKTGWVNKYMERGAYEFERSIVTKCGGDKVSHDWLRRNLEVTNSYWKRSWQTKEILSSTYRNKIGQWFI